MRIRRDLIWKSAESHFSILVMSTMTLGMTVLMTVTPAGTTEVSTASATAGGSELRTRSTICERLEMSRRMPHHAAPCRARYSTMPSARRAPSQIFSPCLRFSMRRFTFSLSSITIISCPSDSAWSSTSCGELSPNSHPFKNTWSVRGG